MAQQAAVCCAASDVAQGCPGTVSPNTWSKATLPIGPDVEDKMPSLLTFQATPAEHQQVGRMPWNVGVLLLYFLLELTKEGCLSENLQQAFRVEPDNVTVREGEAALLKCEVENPSGIVQWAKDGLLLGPDQNIPRFPRYSMVGEPDKGKYNLQVARSRLEDDASYECQVGPSEESNGIISRSVQLTVLIPPKKAVITEYEANSTVTWVAGKEYTVHCRVEDARPPAEIVFRKGAHELADVTSSTQPGSGDKLFHTEAMLTITPESSDNQRQLLCRASNIAAPIPVAVGFTMNVLFPPQPPVIRGYDGPVVKAKDNLVLTCVSLSGNPLATLQWLKNDEVISTNWETDEANQLSRSSLSLRITADDNMATVSCQALNTVLPAPLQASMVLPVVFPPEEVKITGSSSAQENKEISLSCSTSSSNPPVLLRWLLGWREINATEATVSEAANGGMITVSNLTYITNREDNGLPLVCEAFNEAIMYTKTDTVTLRVTYPPQKVWIDVPPPETYFRAGTKVKLSCFASGGNPAPRLEWYKTTCTQVGGDTGVLVQRKLPPGQSGLLKPCTGRQETKAVRDGTSSGSAGNIVSKELILTTSPSDNLAIYRCNATGPSRTTPITAYTFLRVQFPPLHVTITTEDKEPRRGQTVTLTCKSGSSHPPASLTWLKDGKRFIYFIRGSWSVFTGPCPVLLGPAQYFLVPKAENLKETCLLQISNYENIAKPSCSQLSLGAPLCCISDDTHNLSSGNRGVAISMSFLSPKVLKATLNATNLGQKKAEYGGFSISGRVTLVVSSADHGKRVECHAYSPILSEGKAYCACIRVGCKEQDGAQGRARDPESSDSFAYTVPPEFSCEQPLVVQTVEHEAVLLPLLVSASPPEITCRWIFLGEVLLTGGSYQMQHSCTELPRAGAVCGLMERKQNREEGKQMSTDFHPFLPSNQNKQVNKT
ncbi:Nephrin [Varanus komodoensis]|nr:Nephrin [Varanus komodoensis]